MNSCPDAYCLLFQVLMEALKSIHLLPSNVAHVIKDRLDLLVLKARRAVMAKTAETVPPEIKAKMAPWRRQSVPNPNLASSALPDHLVKCCLFNTTNFFENR